MPSILIKNFGPIKEGYTENDGFLDIEKCTVFIGTQGSGKSTIAKVISTLTWLEKALNMGYIEVTNNIAWFQNFFEYQGLRKYFRKDTLIEYIGDAFTIRHDYKHRKFPMTEPTSSQGYQVPKVMYVPAERNFLSAVENAYELKELPGPLFTFAKEVKNAQRQLGDETLSLPKEFGDVKFKHNQSYDQSYLVGEGYELNLTQSSSGFQSFIPVFLVSRYLAELTMRGETSSRLQLNIIETMKREDEIRGVMEDVSLSDNEKVSRVNKIRSRYINTCFFNIVEEPELNLYPTSQYSILNTLLEIANRKQANKLVMTTHSPYIINYLTLAIKANSLLRRITESGSGELLRRLDVIVPPYSTIAASDVAIYELADGRIQKLPDYNGLPSDENYLNEKLSESNELFAQLLEIQQAL